MDASNTFFSNKVCVITGANTGIGLETARGMSRLGATIVLAIRDVNKGEAAAVNIKKSTTNERVFAHQLDLASTKSIRSAAKLILENYERLDILINNAGLSSATRQLTEDGFEMTFGVNHLGHFLLTRLLQERIISTAKRFGNARIINLSSAAHRSSSGILFDDITWSSRHYDWYSAYAHSKLANVLFTNELARRLIHTGVVVHTVHPGMVKSDFFRSGNSFDLFSKLIRVAYPFIAVSPERGAKTTLLVATSPEAAKTTGKYWANGKIKTPKLPVDEPIMAARLWQLSEQLTRESQ